MQKAQTPQTPDQTPLQKTRQQQNYAKNCSVADDDCTENSPSIAACSAYNYDDYYREVSHFAAEWTENALHGCAAAWESNMVPDLLCLQN